MVPVATAFGKELRRGGQVAVAKCTAGGEGGSRGGWTWRTTAWGRRAESWSWTPEGERRVPAENRGGAAASWRRQRGEIGIW